MIGCLSAVEAEGNFVSLTKLVVDAVESGESVGIPAAIGARGGRGLQGTVVEAMRAGERELIVALEGGGVAGAVQLILKTAVGTVEASA